MTYSVNYPGSVPAGATLNASTGVWDWAVTVPGTYEMVFTVHDNDPTGDMTDEYSFTLDVSDYRLPIIDSITGVTTVNEGQDVVLTVTAHDDPANPAGGELSYSVASMPAGASYSWAGNILTWHTAEAEGQGSYVLTIAVTVDSNPARRRSETRTVTVNEVNQAPQLDLSAYTSLPDGEWVNELDTVSFTAAANDPDLPANNLSYTLLGAPAGASINSATGVFMWTPTHAQAGSDYSFQVRVTDAGSLYDEETVSFKVNAVPVFTGAPANVNAVIDRPMQFTVTASDPDERPAGLTYTLVSALPTGAAYDPATRTVTWIPTAAQQGSYTLVFTASDGQATTQFTVTIQVFEGFLRFFPLMFGW